MCSLLSHFGGENAAEQTSPDATLVQEFARVHRVSVLFAELGAPLDQAVFDAEQVVERLVPVFVGGRGVLLQVVNVAQLVHCLHRQLFFVLRLQQL